MEKAMDLEQKTLINVLNQGKQLANQLMNYLDNPSTHGTREFLVERILSSYEKALSMLNWGAFVQEPKPTSSLGNSSSRSEGSDQDFKAQCQQDMFKKRKTLPRWTEQVRVCSGTGLEGPLDDGHSWRKYGQKEILGAHHPRGYYRCTHRHARGCLATKQVQRSDEDPTIIEITYRGRHTCFQASHLTTQSVSMLIESSKLNKDQNQQQKLEEKPQQPQEKHLSFGAGFKRKAEDLVARESIFPSFSFPPTSDGSENVENNIFGESMMENTFMGSFSPPFISPATSESNYLSPCHMNTFGLGHSVQTPESDLAEIISAPTSVTNSPIGNLDYFSVGNMDFDTSFPFDTLEIFS